MPTAGGPGAPSHPARMERLGSAVGAAALALLVALAAAGVPLVSLRPGAAAPLVVRYQTAGPAGALAAGVVGFVAGVVYAARVERAGLSARELARGVCYVPGAVGVAGLAAAALWTVAGGGSVADALVTLAAALAAGVAWLLFVAVALAAPATAGLTAGVRVGQRLPGWLPHWLPLGRHTGTASRRRRVGFSTRAAAAVLPGRSLPDGVEPSPQWFGWWAGALATLLLVGPLLVGPWAALAVTPGGESPVTGRPQGAGAVAAFGALVAGALGLAAARLYRRNAGTLTAGDRRVMATQATLAPMVVAAVGAILALVAYGVVQGAPDGVPGVVASVGGVLWAGVIPVPATGIVAAVVVGVPTGLGVVAEGVVAGLDAATR